MVNSRNSHANYPWIVMLAAFVILSFVSNPVFAGLKAGAVRVDITPPVGVWLSGYGHRKKPSDAVEDRLYSKALVLNDGRTKIAIVSTDLLWVPLEITNQVRDHLHKKIGIPRDIILICGTHTHCGPKIAGPDAEWPDAADSKISTAYVRTLRKKIIQSVLRADKNSMPAQLGAAKGEITEIVYNRRTVRPDDTVAMTFRLPPAAENLTFGPVDPEVSILRVERPGGELIGALVNYACHPVSGAKDPNTFYSISPDYPGVTERAIEKIEGGTAIFALGTAGNMNPRRTGRKRPRAEIGKALAGEVLRRLQTVTTTDDIKLRALRKSVAFPLKQKEAADGGKKPDKSAKTLTTEIQLLAIGDIYILGLPGEVLVEIGLEIKKQAGIENLFIISIANDTIGYVCTRQAYKQGGYEPTGATKLAEGAGELITKEAVKLIKQMKSL